MTQITERFDTLVRNTVNQDQLVELREAKTALEERFRGNENMLMEVRNGKMSAEKREDDLRAGHNKLMEELAKLRDMAFTPKKGHGPMTELQQSLIKWMSTNTLLAESLRRIEEKDQKLQGQMEQIQILSEQLGQAKAEQQKSIGDIEELSRRLTESVVTADREKSYLVCTIVE